MVKAKVGRPSYFNTPQDLQNAYVEWRDTFNLGNERFGEVPDVEGFCDYVGAWRDLLNEYEHKPEFSDTIKRMKNWMYYRKKQLAMANKMPAAIFIFDAKNNAGYVERIESDLTSNGESISFVNEVTRPKK